MEALQAVGFDVVRWLQGFSPALDGPMLLITALGATEFYLVVLPVLYWAAGPGLALRLLLVLLATDVATTLLKQALLAPRPYWLDHSGVRGLVAATSYGLPSGHASTSVAFWGSAAGRVGRRWRPLAVVLIGLIGLSRLYLGVHFPHDIVAGWLLGLAVLGLVTTAERRLQPWLKGRPAGVPIGLAFAASALIVAAGLLVRALMADVPAAEPPGLGTPDAGRSFGAGRSVSDYFTDGGLLFGAVAGIVLLGRQGGFRRARRPLHHLGRVVIGMCGVLLAWRGLAAVFAVLAPDGSAFGDALRYLRYTLLGLWITLAAPWLFRRLGLSEPMADTREGMPLTALRRGWDE